MAPILALVVDDEALADFGLVLHHAVAGMDDEASDEDGVGHRCSPMAAATRSAIADGEFRKLLIASGFEPVLDSGPEQARRFVEEDVARWAPVVKKVGLKLG